MYDIIITVLFIAALFVIKEQRGEIKMLTNLIRKFSDESEERMTCTYNKETGVITFSEPIPNDKTFSR